MTLLPTDVRHLILETLRDELDAEPGPPWPSLVEQGKRIVLDQPNYPRIIILVTEGKKDTR